MEADNIRNLAVIAHVDHGKTTLVDGLLKQSNTFAGHQVEMEQSLIMDTGDLEQERGITISAKITAIEYEGRKINIIDTPGHADFSGEVERTLNMADGCLLIVDAQEGPMPQTKFVLSKALGLGLKPIVVINKIDKTGARLSEVREEIANLFLDLAVRDDQLEFPVYYALGTEGKAYPDMPENLDAAGDLTPVFRAIIDQVPAPAVDPSGPLQMLVTSLDWDNHRGKYAVGRLTRGRITAGDEVTLISTEGNPGSASVDGLFTAKGLQRQATSAIEAGDIAWITGVKDARIGDTLADPSAPESIPGMEIESPTLRVSIGPNTSPFAGQEGRFTTSRQIGARLEKELETNVGLTVEAQGTTFLVSGRGEMHLSVLIETMRREGYEMEIGRPQVVTKVENGQVMEPREELTIEVAEDYVGEVTSQLGKRRAELISMEQKGPDTHQIIYQLPTRAMLGLRSQLLMSTKGTAVMNSLFAGYTPLTGELEKTRNGVLIAHETGEATAYSLQSLEERGTAFVGHGSRVYQGMIVGLNRRGDDVAINVCKGKKLTNVRAAGSDTAIKLAPFTQLSLEESLNFIEDDELVEVTPENIRLRKIHLSQTERKKQANSPAAAR
ncbi:translational GTPase TypA [Candidatus Saccharibacteria bacterium QS_5_54_17]|nr:MAG: translational GTPase TypA [Candidatus Saccharibacteria bacterium QS_5_54_17]